MVACGEGITRICGRFGEGRRSTADNAKDMGEGVSRPSGFATSSFSAYVAAAVFTAVFIYQGFMPSGKVMEAPDVKLPDALQGYTIDEVRYCQNEQCSRMYQCAELSGSTNCPNCGAALDVASLGERTILPSDTMFQKRVYRSTAGHEYIVSAIIGGASKRSIHRPELCLPGQGFTLLTPHEVDVNGRPFRVIKILPPRATMDGPPHAMVYTFFNQAGVRTSSHVRRILVDTWDRTVFNRVDRWVMVSIHAAQPNSYRGFDIDDSAQMAELKKFLEKLAEVLP